MSYRQKHLRLQLKQLQFSWLLNNFKNNLIFLYLFYQQSNPNPCNKNIILSLLKVLLIELITENKIVSISIRLNFTLQNDITNHLEKGRLNLLSQQILLQLLQLIQVIHTFYQFLYSHKVLHILQRQILLHKENQKLKKSIIKLIHQIIKAPFQINY